MTQIEKIQLLKLLYQHRAMGHEFFEEHQAILKKELTPLANNMSELKKSVLSCHLCTLAKSRKNILFGDGNPNAQVMFIGDNPGVSEDEMGTLFAGRSGEMLINIIEKVLLLPKEEVYISTILKCRPPENRVPTMDEVSCCKPYLMQQIAMIKPKIIVALGSTSFHHLTGEYDTTIDKVRGLVLNFGEAKLIPTFHPSFLLRNPSAKKDVLADMLKVRSML